MLLVLYVALLISSSLYLAGVFVAGLMLGVTLAWKGALITVGANYLVYLLQTAQPPHHRGLMSVLVGITIVLGAISGLALLVFA